MSNTPHTENRRRMADDMARALFASMKDSEPLANWPDLVNGLHDADPGYRALVAGRTGRSHEPSEETWDLTLTILQALVDGADRDRCPVCRGEGSILFPAGPVPTIHGGERVECGQCGGTGAV